MRRYMPPTHRRFVETLEHGPDIRAFVSARQTDAPALADHYNRCIEHLSDFRKKHMEIAVRYITMQAPNPQAATGTGGTNFHRFLGTTKRETRERRLP
jgi:indoleamine 2,3-dioxygenase